jgi:hypothetical protein
MRTTAAVFVSTLACAALAGCAAERPIIYPNAKAQQSGPTVAQADIDECAQRATSSGATPQGGGPDTRQVAVNTGTGAAAGAAAGAVYGNAGRGAAAGAAGAAAGSIFRGIFRPHSSPTYRRFVELCLREKGYQITGWE